MKKTPICQIARHMGVYCEQETLIAGYQIDSRLIQPGDLFCPAGEKVHGHQFLKDARERGAVAAVVSKGYEGPDFGLVLLKVEEVFLPCRNWLAR